MIGDVSHDPRTGLPAALVAASTHAQIEAVLTAAADAAEIVAVTSPEDRGRWLDAVAGVLEEHREELARLADWETALGLPRLTGEVVRTANQLRFYAEVARDGVYLGAVLDGATATTPELARVNLPVGVVAVFGASNFPFAFSVLGNDTASAMAAGCAVVVKAHPAHPAVSQRTAELARMALDAAGAPCGMLGIVYAFVAGLEIVKHPAVQAVGFTGSQQGGMKLLDLARARPTPIPVYAEMGTVNPVVVTPAGAAG